MGISDPEVKKLYGRAAGRCSICKTSLFESDVHIGEMAHVIAKSINGPRGREPLSVGRDSYENLILLCRNHHATVDQDTKGYPVERLHEIKRAHEDLIDSVFERSDGIDDDIDSLKVLMRYMPFSNLRYYLESLPSSVHLNIFKFDENFRLFERDNPDRIPFNDNELDSLFLEFILDCEELAGIIDGYTDVNGRKQANFSQATDRNVIHMEYNYLGHDKSNSLERKIQDSVRPLRCSYSNLLSYIRATYPNVKLNTYVD